MIREEIDLSQEMKLEFTIKPSLAYSGGEINGEPVGISIIPSGWDDKFHVIVEFGDMETWDNYFLTSKEIKDKWNIEVERISLMKIIKEKHNDMELGATIRKMYNTKNKHGNN